MQWLDFSTELSNSSIKNLKHFLNMQRGLLIFNIFIAGWESYLTYTNPSNIFSSICLGVLICNILWVFFQLLSVKDDLKNEKERLKRLEEMKDNDHLKGAIAQQESAKAHYERASQEFYKRMEEMSKNNTEKDIMVGVQ